MDVSKPTRCVCAAVITAVLLIASGCGSNNDAEVPGDASPDASPEEPIDEPAAAPSADSDDPSPAKQRRRLLDEIEHWLYLIDVNLEGETVDEIVESNHDMVVLDFIPSEQQNTDYPIGEVIELLHETDHRKLVLAYIDIGQAEDYRVYWEEDWQIGDPDWIVADDPDGWEGNYPVAYWRQEWHDIWLGEDGFVSQIVDAGFDGIYLDWVEAYSDDNVATAGSRDDVDPIEEMVNWVAALAQTGRDGKPEFLVIAQNAAELATENGGYRAVIDALAQEQVWFDGAADNDPPGDCPLPATDELIDTEG